MLKTSKRVTVRFYETEAGNVPVLDFLRAMSPEDRKAVGADLNTVEYGWPIGMPTCRPLGNGLYEVRSQLTGRRTVRTLFGFDGDEIVVVHAFIKKTGATPQADLALARDRLGER